MGLPTLLRIGHLFPGMGESKEFLDTYKPIDYILDWFEVRLNREPKSLDDRFIVALSTTGTGKSTVLPVEIYLKFSEKLKNIIVTQPRVVTAIDIPKTIVNVPVYKNKMKMGKNIGFQTGDYVKKPLEKGILFSTVGILLQFLKSMEPADFCKKYNLIILDEAHDRSTQLDLVFFHIKLLSEKVKLKDMPFVICTSGTMDVELYKKYFNTNTTFIIQGDSYPIEDNWLDYDTENVLSSAVDRIKQIHVTEGDRYISDIVLFSPTNGVINKLKKAVDELNSSDDYFKNSKLLPIGLDSAVFKSVRNEYNYVFDNIDIIPIENLKRKIIMGTNSIETGITLETISYCIDTGLVNSLEYNPVYNLNILIIRPVTKAMARQRRGRVGRIQNGFFYGLYSKETFDSLQDIQYPEMITSDMTTPILNILCSDDTKTGFEILKKIDTMEKIPDIVISSCMNKLVNYGLVDNKLSPTDMGKIVNKIRMLSLENILLILHKSKTVSTLDMITMSSYLSLGKQSITTKKFKFFQSNVLTRDIKKLLKCEWLEFLIIFQEFKNTLKESKGDINKVIEFCDKISLSFDSMINFVEYRYDIILDIHSTAEIIFSDDKSNEIENLYSMAVKINEIEKDSILHKSYIKEFRTKISDLKKVLYNSYKLNLAVCIDTNTFKCLYNDLIVKHYTFICNVGDIVLFDSIMIRKDFVGNYSPTFVNGISNITNCDIPIEPMVRTCLQYTN